MQRKPSLPFDPATYLQSVPLLFKHLSILALPLLAAVVAVLLNRVQSIFTDPMGGMGASIFGWISQLVFLWAFGVAIIQASNAWRGRKGSFDEAWVEGRSKFGGILLAAIGFQFIIGVASMFSGVFGILGILLVLLAAFFLIYVMPAAAIGGMPGQFAISASIRCVRANPVAAVVLAVVFIFFWAVLPNIGLMYLYYWLGPPQLAQQLISAFVEALVLSYLAFPFAKQYDDVAFTRFW